VSAASVTALGFSRDPSTPTSASRSLNRRSTLSGFARRSRSRNGETSTTPLDSPTPATSYTTPSSATTLTYVSRFHFTSRVCHTFFRFYRTKHMRRVCIARYMLCGAMSVRPCVRRTPADLIALVSVQRLHSAYPTFYYIRKFGYLQE